MMVKKVQFIIEEYSDVESPDAIPSERVVNRRLSYPVKLAPLVQSPRWWMKQWRDFGGIKRNERVVGFIPSKIEGDRL